MKFNPRPVLAFLVFIVFLSCKKLIDSAINQGMNAPKQGELIEYIIPKGQHYANQNAYQSTSYDELLFTVKFDSSAIYQTNDSTNQEDINKLYGFSDNNADHQQFSARFGWNWARGALRLYAYVYNNGQRNSEEIATLQIGLEYSCSIKVSGDQYIFSVNKAVIQIPRASTTEKATGYKLYPYFGGDEAAPHEIDIWIKEI